MANMRSSNFFLIVTEEMQSVNKSMDCFHAGQRLMSTSFKIESKYGKDTLEPDFCEKAIGRVTTVDSSLLWLYLLRIYVKATGDREFTGDEITTNAVKDILVLLKSIESSLERMNTSAYLQAVLFSFSRVLQLHNISPVLPLSA